VLQALAWWEWTGKLVCQDQPRGVDRGNGLRFDTCRNDSRVVVKEDSTEIPGSVLALAPVLPARVGPDSLSLAVPAAPLVLSGLDPFKSDAWLVRPKWSFPVCPRPL